MGASESNLRVKGLRYIRTGNLKELHNLMMKKGSSFVANLRDSEGLPPITLAVTFSRIAVMEFLLSRHIGDVNTVDSYGLTPLHHATNHSHDQIVKVLVERGANPNARERDTLATPLLTACSRGDYAIAQMLVEHKADVNIPEKNGMTCLHWASKLGNIKLAKYLLEEGADVNARDNSFQTAIRIAKQEGHVEIVRILETFFNRSNNIAKLSRVEDFALDSSESDRNSRKEDERLCKVCWERPIDIVLLWCGHICCCLSCSQYLQDCPICVKGIEKVQRVFMA